MPGVILLSAQDNYVCASCDAEFAICKYRVMRLCMSICMSIGMPFVWTIRHWKRSLDHQIHLQKLNLELSACQWSRRSSPSYNIFTCFVPRTMSILERQARAFFGLSRASKGSRTWRRCCSIRLARSFHKPKPYYVTTPIFYVNAGERLSSAPVTDSDSICQPLTLATSTPSFSPIY